MKYRLQTIWLSLSKEIIEFEAPENLSCFHFTLSNGMVKLTALQSFGDGEVPNKKYKVFVLRDKDVVEHWPNYEPTVTLVNEFNSYFCYLVS